MKGLEVAELYFKELGRPMLEKYFSNYLDQIAVGLVGPGSECFTYDDEFSRDHDWGPSFCIFLNHNTYTMIGEEVQKKYEDLPKEFMGYPSRNTSSFGGGRTGVFEVGNFYKQFIGLEGPPKELSEWRRIPETNLATATNGKVFVDPSGEFSKIRNTLKGFYPEDIRLKKIASRCMSIAQVGQYNYPRSIKRKEKVAARYCEGDFIKNAISMIFLLNKKYTPFYKWMHRALQELPILGIEMFNSFDGLVNFEEVDMGKEIYEKKIQLIEFICNEIINELKVQGLTDSNSDFLLDHGPLVQKRIKDPFIKNINVWLE